MTAIHLFFAGLWPLVWHWGIAVGIIILCLGAEVVIQLFGASIPFVGKWLVPIQKDLLWVAVAAGLFLYGFSDGVKVEHARALKQQEALKEQVGTVVNDVLRDPANQPKPLIKGQKRVLPRDRWDSPEN